jgi:hypothetical protein
LGVGLGGESTGVRPNENESTDGRASRAAQAKERERAQQSAKKKNRRNGAKRSTKFPSFSLSLSVLFVLFRFAAPSTRSIHGDPSADQYRETRWVRWERATLVQGSLRPLLVVVAVSLVSPRVGEPALVLKMAYTYTLSKQAPGEAIDLKITWQEIFQICCFGARDWDTAPLSPLAPSPPHPPTSHPTPPRNYEIISFFGSCVILGTEH